MPFKKHIENRILVFAHTMYAKVRIRVYSRSTMSESDVLDKPGKFLTQELRDSSGPPVKLKSSGLIRNYSHQKLSPLKLKMPFLRKRKEK